MDSDIAFVKDQIAVHERMAGKYADQPHRSAMHLATANRFRALIERIEKLTNPQRAELNNKVNICLSDLEGLPDELMAELGISDTDKQEMVIEDIIAKNNGVISLDKLLINYYKREKQIIKRSTFVSKLYRMGEKGMIFNVPGKRGYYSTQEMTSDDVKRVFGEPDKIADDSNAAPEQKSISSEAEIGDRPATYRVETTRVRRRRRRALPSESDFV